MHLHPQMPTTFAWQRRQSCLGLLAAVHSRAVKAQLVEGSRSLTPQRCCVLTNYRWVKSCSVGVVVGPRLRSLITGDTWQAR
jgi:hypothetical protein